MLGLAGCMDYTPSPSGRVRLVLLVLLITLQCLSKAVYPIPITFYLFILRRLGLHQVLVVGMCISLRSQVFRPRYLFLLQLIIIKCY